MDDIPKKVKNLRTHYELTLEDLKKKLDYQ